jgi:dTDP-4-amino-4,6-dideoxygalactose transaminase
MWVNEKEKMIRHLLDQGIQCRPIWKPMNHLPMFKKSIYVTNHDVANEVYQHCVSIPSSTNLLDEDVEKVIMATKQFLYQA